MRCSKSRLNLLGGALIPTAAFWAVMLASPPPSLASSSQEVTDTPLETTAIVSSEQSAAIASSDGEVFLTRLAVLRVLRDQNGVGFLSSELERRSLRLLRR